MKPNPHRKVGSVVNDAHIVVLFRLTNADPTAGVVIVFFGRPQKEHIIARLCQLKRIVVLGYLNVVPRLRRNNKYRFVVQITH